METVVMYRPVGPEELSLLEESSFAKWPPRLPVQPIFYPVTNVRYAEEIAERWNVKDSGFGAVTEFDVRREFVDRYPIPQVGQGHHQEWWIPADDLEELNENIVGPIRVIRTYGHRP